MSEKNVPNRRYTGEFREEAARLANSVGHNEAARRLGVPVATIGNWARLQLKQGAVSSAEVAARAPRTKPAVSELEAENSRLRKELASAKLDIEILSNFLSGPAATRRAETRRSYTDLVEECGR